MPGMDFGFNLNSYQKGSATIPSGANFQVDEKLTDVHTDIRLRFGVAAWYKKFGLTVSYAHGLKSFDKGLVTPNGAIPATDVYSELFRFGIAYRIL